MYQNVTVYLDYLNLHPYIMCPSILQSSLPETKYE